MPINSQISDPFEQFIQKLLENNGNTASAYVHFVFPTGQVELPIIVITDAGGGPNSIDMGDSGGCGITERPDKLITICAADRDQAYKLSKAFDTMFECVAWNMPLSDDSKVLDSIPIMNWRSGFWKADPKTGIFSDMWFFRRWYEFKISRLTASGGFGG